MVVERDIEIHTLHSYAVDGLIKELGLKDSDRYLLEGHIEFREADPGITLLREGCADVSFTTNLSKLKTSSIINQLK